MISKRQSSSLHAHVLMLHSYTHALPSPSSLLLLLLFIAATCMFGSDSMSALALSISTTATRKSRPPVRPLSRMSMTATTSTSSDTSADTTSPTPSADDSLTSSSPDLNSLQPTPADLALHSWCTQTAGIALSPSIQICTTPQSVGGRGLFATQDVAEGDVLALIPREVVLGVQNCRDQLGVDVQVESISTTKNKTRRKRRWIKNRLSKLSFRRRGGNSSTSTIESETWAPFLTKYALQAKASKHPWSEWIEQWNRCDPMHDAYVKMGPVLQVSSNDNDNKDDDLPEYRMMMEKLICDTATKIKNDMMPHLDETHLQAAVSIRLSRLEEHFRTLGFADDDTIDLDEALRLYSLITSRAIELDSDTTAVLPFYDLANHSLDPNLGLEYVENDDDGKTNCVESAGFYSIFARRDIAAGSELFFRYTKLEEAMDDNSALWAAINWGIPHFEEQYETPEYMYKAH